MPGSPASAAARGVAVDRAPVQDGVGEDGDVAPFDGHDGGARRSADDLIQNVVCHCCSLSPTLILRWPNLLPRTTARAP